MPFQKWPKINFWTGKKFKTAKNAISRKKKLFIWFHEFLCLDFLKFSGPCKDAVCYGVEIPGTEGKAGMVAILDPERSVDLDLLAKQIRNKLPKYARPLFIRIIKDLPLTGTYKLMKNDLQKQGLL